MTASLPPGPFDLILADPPWAFRTHTSAGRTPTAKRFNEAEDHYATMAFADLAALDVGALAARDAVLVLWVVGSHLDEALALGKAWGFAFATDLFYWLKQKRIRPDQLDLFTGDIAPPPMSMGYYTRKQVEPCLLFTRGKGLPVRDHAVRQLIVAPRAEHSRKPAEQYDRLAALFGNDLRCIELFARQTRPGWTAWGNEVGKFEEQTA